MDTPGAGSAPAGRGPFRVLIVDDHGPARRALAKVLQSSGYVVTAASTGAEALQALARPPAPDFLLTDLALPDIDGREIARAAQALPDPPFVALITGWALEPDLIDPKRLAVDHVFLKPLKAAELLAKLDEVRRGAAG